MDIFIQLCLNSLIAGSIYMMIAIGFNLIFGTVKFFDLGAGAMSAIGGYVVFFLTRSFGFNLYVSIVLAILFTGLIGYLVNKLVYSKLRKNGASNMSYLVASLGVSTVIQAVIAIIFSSQFYTLSNLVPSEVLDVFGGSLTYVQLGIFIIGILIMIGLGMVLKFTMFGKAVKAISDDEEVSKIVGINTSQIIGRVFFIGSAICGLAGILVGLDTGIEPMMGFSLLLKGVIAAIIGGVGNIYGGVLGAFLLGFVENFSIWQISGEWKDAIAFVILIIFLLFRPRGILGKK
jgi:branched-chain amino acid transport system permease protein